MKVKWTFLFIIYINEIVSYNIKQHLCKYIALIGLIIANILFNILNYVIDRLRIGIYNIKLRLINM